jgi:hypothetical protein
MLKITGMIKMDLTEVHGLWRFMELAQFRASGLAVLNIQILN